MKWCYKYFINGLIVIVPIAITAFVIVQIFSVAESLVGDYLPVHFPGIGLVTGLAVIFIVGWLSSYWITKKIIGWGERLLTTIPVVKFIYKSVKQLSTVVFESKQLLKQPVLVPYPHPGTKALGFIMSELSEPIACKLEEECLCVFVPMSLNMTAGFNIFVPKRDIIFLEVTSESALQYVVTAGVMMPEHSVEQEY
jgi:uncharacterized membrane protein